MAYPAVGRPSKLTTEVRSRILYALERGAFDVVAARYAGISHMTFAHWMADDRPRFLEFKKEVELARGRARANAEFRVFEENPLAWLRWGPGRERPGEPGWTDSTETQIAVTGSVQLVPWVRKEPELLTDGENDGE